MTGAAGGKAWERAAREHRAALDHYLEFARGIDASIWTAPARAGGWSPAEVTEHLALAYEAILHELATGESMAPRMGAAARTLLRWFLLPHMLFHRSMPRATAPRETRPARAPASREEGLARLWQLGDRVAATLAERPGAAIVHPYFGELPRARALRLAALHLEHHQRRLSSALTETG